MLLQRTAWLPILLDAWAVLRETHSPIASGLDKVFVDESVSSDVLDQQTLFLMKARADMAKKCTDLDGEGLARTRRETYILGSDDSGQSGPI